MDSVQLRDAYTAVKKTCKNDWRSETASQAIIDLAATSLKFLTAECEQTALNSLVPGKRYFSETKLDSRSREVVEICVPDQWLAYQTLLSKMDRIYYFDVPVRYQELTHAFPEVIQIRPFQEFFTEIVSVGSR